MLKNVFVSLGFRAARDVGSLCRRLNVFESLLKSSFFALGGGGDILFPPTSGSSEVERTGGVVPAIRNYYYSY
jgi:hypothetical protein